MAGAPLQVSSQLTEADLRHFYERSMRISPRVWLVIGIFALATIVLWLVVGRDAIARKPVVFWAQFLALGLSVYMGTTPWRAARQERSSLEKFNSFTLAFEPDAVEVHHPRGSGRHPWSDFERSLETDRAFMLYLTATNAYILPKRGIPASDQAALRAILREKLADRSRQE